MCVVCVKCLFLARIPKLYLLCTLRFTHPALHATSFDEGGRPHRLLYVHFFDLTECSHNVLLLKGRPFSTTRFSTTTAQRTLRGRGAANTSIPALPPFQATNFHFKKVLRHLRALGLEGFGAAGFDTPVFPNLKPSHPQGLNILGFEISRV